MVLVLTFFHGLSYTLFGLGKLNGYTIINKPKYMTKSSFALLVAGFGIGSGAKRRIQITIRSYKT